MDSPKLNLNFLQTILYYHLHGKYKSFFKSREFLLNVLVTYQQYSIILTSTKPDISKVITSFAKSRAKITPRKYKTKKW